MTKATDAMRAANLKHGHSLRGRQSKEYRCYRSMLNRCYQSSNQDFALYGGRGIEVCDRWRGDGGFEAFLSDMGLRPSLGHSLDRIDNDGPYSPDNCRWATIKQQVRNRRMTVKYRGRPMVEWSEIYAINYHTLMDRWRVGKRGDALFAPTSLWRPISSAPKDGTPILGRCRIPKDGPPRYQIRKTYWGKTSHIPLYGWNWGRDPEGQELWEPTTWQPLPSGRKVVMRCL